MKKSAFVILLILFIIKLNAQVENNQSGSMTSPTSRFNISFNTGLSIPLRGTKDYNKNWDPNPLLAVNPSFNLSPYFQIGTRFSFNYWIVNQYKVTEAYHSEILWGDIKGYAYIIEFSPFIRANIAQEYKKSYFFVQTGPGYYFIHEQYNFSGTLKFNLNDIPKSYYGSKNLNISNIGFNVAAGIKAGHIEIYPMFSLIFTKPQVTQYLSINFGLAF